MPAICDSLLSDTQGLVPVDLNQTGFWFTLPKSGPGSCAALGKQGLSDQMVATDPHLFLNVPVFLPVTALAALKNTVGAIEAVGEIPAFSEAVIAWAPKISQVDPGPATRAPS